ncbi:unnamed protein product [Bemisia tabaci]|uniref:Death-inducer obliterator 1 n=1 Tax=Bemisia tabaci TaxID=7038 RepID=A0A9N9ZYZ4_BEMTA|nr:unnamed protein product [Bemisia tabaci]
MSSSVVIERTEEKKNDDTLVIIVNADGTLSVDPDTLQKVLASQQNTPVSILQCVDSGQPATDEENENGLKANLVVEGYFPQNNNVPVSTALAPATISASNPVIDNLYVSDKAENKPMNVHSSIQFDHCYTSFYQPKKVSNASDVRQQQQNQANKGKNTIVMAQKKTLKTPGILSKSSVKPIAPTATQVPAVSSSGEVQLILSPTKQLQLGPITTQSSNFTIVSPLQSSDCHAVIKTPAAGQKTEGRTLMRIVPKQGPKFSKLSPGQELNVQNINLSILSPSKVVQSPLKQQVAVGDHKVGKVKLNRQPLKLRKQEDKPPSSINEKQRQLDMQLKKVSLNKNDNTEGVAFVSSSGGPVEVKTSNVETKPATSGKKQAPKTVSAPLVVGPELFSAPDIIRRISTEQNLTKPDDKNLDNSEAMVAKLHELNYNPDMIAVSSDGSLIHHSQNLQEELPVADSSTGLDLNNLPVVFASNQDDMISKSPQISKRPGAKSLSFKQMTLSNNLKVISPKTGDKVLTTKINQPSEAPMNQQRDLDMNNLLSPSFLSDAPLSRKKSLLQESPAARGTGRERKVNPKYDTAYTDGAELDLDSKPAVGTPKKPASAKKQDRRRSNEKKNPGNRVGNENLDGDEIAAALDDNLPSEDDQSWNSEDDPDRLWCICKKPHNNRFMICCDTCEEWFHGSCVGITKAMGEDMEKKGIEWVCPQCKEKKPQDGKGLAASKEVKKTPDQAESKKVIQKRKGSEVHSTNIEDPSSRLNRSISTESRISAKRCHVCQENAPVDGIFCSEKCIDAHVDTFLELEEKNEKGSSKKLDRHVMMLEKHTGRVFSNNMAPTIGSLKQWLYLHPTCHIVMRKDHPSTDFYSKQRKLAPIPKKTPQPVKDGNRIVTVTVATTSGTILSGAATLAPASTSTVTTPKSGLPTTPTSSTAPSQATIQAKQQTIQQSLKAASVTPQNSSKTQIAPTQKVLKQQTLTMTGTLKTITPNQAGKTPIAILSRGLNKTPPSAAQTPVSKQITVKRPSVKEVKQEQKEKPKPAQKIDKRKSDLSASKRVSEDTPTTPKTPDNEPIRAKCRQMLQEALMLRIKGCSDIQITEEEVSKLVQDIEEEHFVVYKDAAKYRTKIRSLVLNIKAPKNDTLFRKIAMKTYNPQQVARLSQDEMASEELATWRQNENKHSLDMIKKNELDLLAMSKTCVLKTHKGEQEIENVENRKEVSAAEFVPDLNESDSIVEPKSSPKFPAVKIDETKKSEKEKESKDKHRSSSRRHESSKHSSSSSSSSSRHRRSKRHKSDREKDKDKIKIKIKIKIKNPLTEKKMKKVAQAVKVAQRAAQPDPLTQNQVIRRKLNLMMSLLLKVENLLKRTKFSSCRVIQFPNYWILTIQPYHRMISTLIHQTESPAPQS